MRSLRFLGMLLVVCASVAMISGCDEELKNCKLQTEQQTKQIAQLETEAQTTRLELDQLKRKLATAEGMGGADAEAMKQKIAALEEDLAKKKALIASMQQQLLSGGIQLPAELNTLLEDFAKKSPDMVTYDPARGIVKFKSDLLFEKGSDKVAADAVDAVKSLCGIMNSEKGKDFDIVIAGHTDDLKIAKPETREVHPTNWHLSAHRGISVLNVMAENGIASERMSVRGFGEFRPIAPNEPNKKGNSQNRRVEIYIVPRGV
ncbi:MAG: OmpA family protein [Planctomycetota bacterium]|nr:OmpA family protein [Planctomycetota bacterium]